MDKSPDCMLTEFKLSFEEAKLLTTKIAGAISKLIIKQNKDNQTDSIKLS